MPCLHCGAPSPADAAGSCPRCGAMSFDGAIATETPASLDGVARQELGERFAIGAMLSTGTNALSYLAEERETGGRVVLRVFALAALRDLGVARPLQDALLAETTIDHPHVLAAYRSGTTARLLWSATPHVEGRTLARALAFGGPLSAGACLRLVRQLVAGLQELHQRGIVHGALSPAVVLIGEDDRARITDVAIERLLGDAPELVASSRHHPIYTAPEVSRGAHPAPSEDQYALAVTVCECLTGPWPIEGNGIAPGITADGLVAHVMRARPDVPAPFRTTLRRALSPRPADRFPNVRAFAAALEGQIAPASSAAASHSDPGQAQDAGSPHVIFVNDTPGRVVLRVGAGMALAALVLLLGAVQLFQADPHLPRLAPAVVSAPPRTPSLSARESGGLALPDRLPAPEALDASTAAPIAPDTSLAAEDSPATADTNRAREPDATAPRVPASPSAPRRTTVPAVTFQASPGRLFVSSRPWGALHVDGQFVGNTPISSLPLAAGTHRIRITREGFASWEREIVVESGRDVRLIDIILRRVPP